MPHRIRTVMLAILMAAAAAMPAGSGQGAAPRILTVREQAAAVNRMTLKRLETILPQAMAEAGLDMWLIVCQEDNLDPVFRTMIPYDTWCPITQILALSRRPDGTVERFNLSRTDMKGLHKDAWDWRAWERDRKETQWDALARLVKERDPRRIGINESDEIWAAGIPKPKIYSHSIGLYLHEPGPLIGLPWEQVDTGQRGEVKVVANSSFAVELSVAGPVPEWGGRELTMAQEQNCVVTAQGPVFLDGRQTRLYLIR